MAPPRAGVRAGGDASRSATRARTWRARRRWTTFWLVANAVERDPSIRETLARYENARVCEAGHGAGVYEAVVSTLMG